MALTSSVGYLCRATAAALTFVATACGGAMTAPERRPPDFGGVVAALTPPSGAWEFNLRVQRSSGDAAIVWIQHNTRLFVTDSDGNFHPARPEGLIAGAAVEVWTTGVEYRSLPPQYAGTQIVVR